MDELKVDPLTAAAIAYADRVGRDDSASAKTKIAKAYIAGAAEQGMATLRQAIKNVMESEVQPLPGLTERTRRLAQEMHLDMQHPYTKILAIAMAAVEMDAENQMGRLNER